MAQQDHPAWLLESLRSLPAQTDVAYEKRVHLLRQEPASTGHELDDGVLKAIADDEGLADELRFSSYFVWQTKLWRRYDYREFRDNVRDYREVFESQPMFDHQQAMSLMSRSDHDSLQEALVHARHALDNLSSSPGVLNLFVEIVAELGERYPDHVRRDELTTAFESIKKAIRIDRRYGKYYANRARLLALSDRYDEATREIRKAIEVEPSSDSPVYASRLARYQFIEAQIDTRRQANELLEEQRKVRDEIRRTRSETMLMVGLLASIVGFIVTGFDIATDYEPLEAGAIIGMLAGSILIVFTGFGELARFSLTLKARTFFTLTTGLILLGSSALLLWRLSNG